MTLRPELTRYILAGISKERTMGYADIIVVSIIIFFVWWIGFWMGKT
jgi:hypothetical protein